VEAVCTVPKTLSEMVTGLRRADELCRADMFGSEDLMRIATALAVRLGCQQPTTHLEAHRIGCEARLTGKLRNQHSSLSSANTPTAERMSARLKSRRLRNSVALFFTKFQDQVTSATVESPGPRRARNSFTELKFNQTWVAES
jgi:hypothetical protein